MHKSFVRWSTTVKGLGAGRTLLYVLKRLLEGVTGGRAKLHVYDLVAQPVARTRQLPPGRGKSIEVCEIGLDEALSLPVDRPRRVLVERFRQGARCLVARVQGNFVGFIWLQLGSYEEDEVRCLFVPKPERSAAWDFDVFVEPSARLGMTFAKLWDEANHLLSSHGMEWSISRISVFNADSIAAHRRLGLRRIGTAGFLCRGPVQLMVSNLRPYVHLALRRASRPVLPVVAPLAAFHETVRN
jgi:hypothetical protein